MRTAYRPKAVTAWLCRLLTKQRLRFAGLFVLFPPVACFPPPAIERRPAHAGSLPRLQCLARLAFPFETRTPSPNFALPSGFSRARLNDGLWTAADPGFSVRNVASFYIAPAQVSHETDMILI